MSNLVFKQEDQILTTSRKIASNFNKTHRHVLRDIDEMKKGVQNWAGLFYETTYTHNQNKQTYREYLINKDGFVLLTMGFTGKKALDFKLKYIEAFNQMENQLKEASKPSYMIDDPIKRAEQWIKEQEEVKQLSESNEQKDQLIGEMKPKVDYVDSILENKSLVTITQIAKDYGMSGRAMNDLLNVLGVQYKQSKQWLLYRKHHDGGYTHSKTTTIPLSDGTYKTVMNTKWTQKGRLFLYNLLKENDIIPTIES